jgi:hypothetical protein
LAVTVASIEVVSVVCALPFESVLTNDPVSTPADVAKLTGAPASALPFTSTTFAVTTADPPFAEIVVGFAVNVMRPTAAVPTEILTGPVPLLVGVVVVPPLFVPPPPAAVEAAPDMALMVAVPF